MQDWCNPIIKVNDKNRNEIVCQTITTVIPKLRPSYEIKCSTKSILEKVQTFAMLTNLLSISGEKEDYNHNQTASQQYSKHHGCWNQVGSWNQQGVITTSPHKVGIIYIDYTGLFNVPFTCMGTSQLPAVNYFLIIHWQRMNNDRCQVNKRTFWLW